MADITTDGGGKKGIPIQLDKDTAHQKLRALYMAATFKIRKNHYKDVGNNNGSKWPIESHDPDGGRNWSTADINWLKAKLLEEVAEFFLAEANFVRTDHPSRSMLLEGGDIMNLIMMCMDNKVGAAEGLPPKIVCLCGSTKFKEQFEEANKRETLAGKIVLSVGFFAHREPEPIDAQVKIALDKLHFRKIDLADEILVIDVGGYIGDSTYREIVYANAQSKPVRYLSRET